MLVKVDCLPNAVGKQPSIPLIYLGRKWTLNWWWWWWFIQILTWTLLHGNGICWSGHQLVPSSHFNPSYIYRPISNLTFISKVMEKIVAKQLIAYLASNNLMPRLQSGFRSGHSTETAILRVLSDINSSIDQGQVALLALLDVSAAFDTVDHDILLERLSKSFGITGSAHHWIRSFLTLRTQTVHVGTSISTAAPGRWALGHPTGIRPRTSPICPLHSGCCRDRPGRSSLCRWYTSPWQLSGFGCRSYFLISSPFHQGSSPMDGIQQASTESGQNSVYLVWYETTTREAKSRLTVLGVANSSVRHTRPEPRGHPWQRAADGGPHLTAMSFLFFPAASFARDSPLSHSEIDPHACAQLHLQQDRLLQQRPLRCQPVSTRPSPIHPECSGEDRLEDSEVLPHLGQHSRRASLAPSSLPARVQDLPVRSELPGRHTAPAYLQELCIAVFSSAGRRSLRSASRGDLVVPSRGLHGPDFVGPARGPELSLGPGPFWPVAWPSPARPDNSSFHGISWNFSIQW